MMSTIPDILIPDQTAAYLQVNRETIYRYIREGKLVAAKPGRSYRIRRRSLDFLLMANRTRPDITLRDYSEAEIADFFAQDCLIPNPRQRSSGGSRLWRRPRRRRVDRQTLLFFDAACPRAAAGRPAGGSGFLLQLCQHGLLHGAVSPIVLWEAETNIIAKLPPALVIFHQLLTSTPFVITPAPPASAIAHDQRLVNPQDAHVVAAASMVSAPYLLSLDRPFLRELEAAQLSIRGLTL